MISDFGIKVVMLWAVVVLDIVAGALLVGAWYWWFARRNRQRAAQLVRWIQGVFAPRGEVSAVQWMTPSRFHVCLRLAPTPFRKAAVTVHLLPREMPIQWLVSRLRDEQETVLFQADLDYPPSFNLEVHNHRWCGRSRRLPPEPHGWTLEHTPPFILTTRNDWQRDITQMMNGLVASRECDCMTVCFRRTSPHFSATVPLRAISPKSASGSDIFHVLRELASGASAAKF
jgi:hypothetical protein